MNNNINQDKITHYLTLRNKADMEIEATGWVSEETDDALENSRWWCWIKPVLQVQINFK